MAISQPFMSQWNTIHNSIPVCIYAYVYLFWKNIYPDPLSIFFNWIGLFVCLLSYVNSLQILDINPLSDLGFAYIFLYWVGYLYNYFMVSFVVQKLFSWVQSHCSFLLLSPSPLESGTQIHCQGQCPGAGHLCFLPRASQFQVLPSNLWLWAFLWCVGGAVWFVSVSLLVVCLFTFPISSWFSLRRSFDSKNLSVSSRFFN